MSLLRPEVDHLITEADAPLVNRFSAKQQRLLVEPLYSSWGRDRTGLELAEREQSRADAERERAHRLAARLRAAGLDPDES